MLLIIESEPTQARREQSKLPALRIDLFNCQPSSICDADTIRHFSITLCDTLELRRYGQPLIWYTDNGLPTQGHRLLQFGDELLIAAHFAEARNNVYVDIWNHTFVALDSAAACCKHFFQPQRIRIGLTQREVGYKRASSL